MAEKGLNVERAFTEGVDVDLRQYLSLEVLHVWNIAGHNVPETRIWVSGLIAIVSLSA